MWRRMATKEKCAAVTLDAELPESVHQTAAGGRQWRLVYEIVLSTCLRKLISNVILVSRILNFNFTLTVATQNCPFSPVCEV